MTVGQQVRSTGARLLGYFQVRGDRSQDHLYVTNLELLATSLAPLFGLFALGTEQILGKL